MSIANDTSAGRLYNILETLNTPMMLFGDTMYTDDHTIFRSAFKLCKSDECIDFYLELMAFVHVTLEHLEKGEL